MSRTTYFYTYIKKIFVLNINFRFFFKYLFYIVLIYLKTFIFYVGRYLHYILTPTHNNVDQKLLSFTSIFGTTKITKQNSIEKFSR